MRKLRLGEVESFVPGHKAGGAYESVSLPADPAYGVIAPSHLLITHKGNSTGTTEADACGRSINLYHEYQ